MRYIFFILMFIISCKNQDASKSVPPTKQSDFRPYDMILAELTDLDITPYKVTFKIDKFYSKSDVEEKYLDKLMKSERVSLEVIKGENYSIEISEELSNNIEKTNRESQKKMSLDYLFSTPFEFGKNKVIILNTIMYHIPNSKVVKGGGKRVIIFEKLKNSWEIKTKVELMDF